MNNLRQKSLIKIETIAKRWHHAWETSCAGHAFLTWSATAIVFTFWVLHCPKGWIYNRAALLTLYNGRYHDHVSFDWNSTSTKLSSVTSHFSISLLSSLRSCSVESTESSRNARKESGLLHHFYGCAWIYSRKWTCGPELVKNNDSNSPSTVAIASAVKIMAATINGQT